MVILGEEALDLISKPLERELNENGLEKLKVLFYLSKIIKYKFEWFGFANKTIKERSQGKQFKFSFFPLIVLLITLIKLCCCLFGFLLAWYKRSRGKHCWVFSTKTNFPNWILVNVRVEVLADRIIEEEGMEGLMIDCCHLSSESSSVLIIKHQKRKAISMPAKIMIHGLSLKCCSLDNDAFQTMSFVIPIGSVKSLSFHDSHTWHIIVWRNEINSYHIFVMKVESSLWLRGSCFDLFFECNLNTISILKRFDFKYAIPGSIEFPECYLVSGQSKKSALVS